MTELVVSGLVVDYGGRTRAVDHVGFTVEPGQFVAFLGPSGSGKTSLLRAIAGYVVPTSGLIRIGDHDVTKVPPRWRDCGMVFQDYALFPHMSVFDNVAFGLRARRVPRRDVGRRVEEALELVQLGAYAARRPAQLSGGQRQRVALARAVVVEPKLLLMDEPLGALDLQLREQMQVEIRRLQRELGVTTIYVTHDQHEAFSMADRILVMNEGHVVTDAAPRELYARPASSFTARFIGGATLLELPMGQATTGDSLDLPGAGEQAVLAEPLGEDTACVFVCLRPEAVRCTESPHPGASPATVTDARFIGGGTILTLSVAGTPLRAVVGEGSFVDGQTVFVSWPLDAGHVIEEDKVGRPTAREGQRLRAVPVAATTRGAST